MPGEESNNFEEMFAKVLEADIDPKDSQNESRKNPKEEREHLAVFEALSPYFTPNKQKKLKQLIEHYYAEGFFRLEGKKAKSLKKCLDFIHEVFTRGINHGNNKGAILLPRQISFETFLNFLNDIEEEKRIKS